MNLSQIKVTWAKFCQVNVTGYCRWGVGLLGSWNVSEEMELMLNLFFPRMIRTKKIGSFHVRIARASGLHSGMSSTNKAKRTTGIGKRMVAYMLKKKALGFHIMVSRRSDSSSNKRGCLVQMLQDWKGGHHFGDSRTNRGSCWVRKVHVRNQSQGM